MRKLLVAAVLASAAVLTACGGGSSSETLPPQPQGPPGTLDPSFGAGGVTVTSLGSDVTAAALALQPDGKIVVAGRDSVGNVFTFVVARYNEDGSLDTSFGNGGTVLTSFAPDSAQALAVAIQPDGKIVAVGNSAGSTCAIVRYDTNGALDETFGSGGRVLANAPADVQFGRCQALALQSDGKIVAAANAFGNFAVARFNADGTLDALFGDGGWVHIGIARSGVARAVFVGREGKIVVVGSGYTILPLTQQVHYEVVRYDTNGVLDSSFGVGGVATSPPVLNGQLDALYAALQTDGRIVVVGQDWSSLTVTLSRLLSDGAPDPSFGAGGVVTSTIPTGFPGSVADNLYGLAMQSNGKIVAAVATRIGGGEFEGLLMRNIVDGTPDTTFGAGGTVAVSATAPPLALAIQPDGRIVIAANTKPAGRFFVARYFGDPARAAR